MSAIELESCGKRVYVVGNSFPIKDRLKSAGCHWDGERRQWWIGANKRSEVERIVGSASGDAVESATENADDIKVIGKARYKGRNYYVRWAGECRNGSYKARLVTLDAKIDFWANCARPGGCGFDGSGDVAVIVKTYHPRERYGKVEHTTLGSLKRFIERKKEEDAAGGKPDDDCYLRDGQWLCRGCGECARLGTMCPTCQHDTYDS